MTRAALLLLLASLTLAQGSAEDYRRSGELNDRYWTKHERFRPGFYWLPGDEGVAWEEDDLIHVVDGRTGDKRTGTKEELGFSAGPKILEPEEEWGASPAGHARTKITFENTLDRPVRIFWADERGRAESYGNVMPGQSRTLSTYAGHVWLADFKRNDLAGIWTATLSPGIARIDETSVEKAGGRAEVDRGARVHGLSIKDHNVKLSGKDLSTDGTDEDRYDRPLEVSPDGRFVVCLQATQVDLRQIPIVSSAPDDQLQPKLTWLTYPKPGDERSQKRPRLFDVDRKAQVPVDDAPFADSYSVRFLRWSPDSARAYFLYNRRGHAEYAIRAVEAPSGKVTDIVVERSDTFVDYSQKTEIHWLDDRGELLWASERDGRNHLYLFDAATGELKGQVTQGDFVLREVEHVDEEAGVVWFTALGIHPDQDPYHRHLARVNLDGSGLVAVTASDGTHQWQFNEDRSLVVASWSRVDQPQVTELRRTEDGSLVAELGRDDISGLLEAGWKMPKRFAFKGRDGKTDIWGMVLFPSNFDESKSYPVIESIYAGPHDHHVPKRFGTHISRLRVAELGFIVVRIDGMGTNWRTKEFHDVCWQNLKDGGFPDRIAWIQAAAEEVPQMDLTRVGIYGGSAGGQNTLAALLHHGDFYHVGVSDCGCHDNRMDKTWWNEQWMGKVGPHYEESSNVTHADKLTGKLMLTVGELDRNVDPASTMQVVDALIRANKDFDLVVMPGEGHGIGEGKYLFRRRQDFFVRHLWGKEPRWEQ